MTIRFVGNRLHVGLRARDWTDVWLQPDLKNKSEEGESLILLFSSDHGEATPREPMNGEVMWNQHFDPQYCESRAPAEKKRLHNQFLTDAYEYLAEQDPQQVRQLETDLHDPDWRRWQSWFKEAKKFKHSQMKRKDTLRRKRFEEAKERGLSEAEARKEVNSDTADSAYETDDEEEDLRRSTSDMPPPRRPASKKRKPKYVLDDGKSGRKKSRQSTASSWSPAFYMSGANGGRTASRDRSMSSRSDDFEDEVMDTSDPTNPQPSAPGLNGQLGFGPFNTPPATKEYRGNAASMPDSHRHPIQSADQPSDLNDMDERRRRHIEEHDELGIDEDQAIQAAIRASMEPESVRAEDDVIDSTEADINDS